MGELLLAIDNGTQSVRALLFNLRGNLLAKAQVKITPYVSPRPGWAEQDPDYFWRSLVRACRQLWAQAQVDKSTIAALAVTTQRATVVNVDRSGRPLRPAIVWPDQRRTERLPPVRGPWGALFKLLGIADTVAYLQAETEANWIRVHQPEIWAKTYKYMYLSGYLNYKLTGRFADSIGGQVGYMPFDYKKLRWASAHDWKWLAIPMSRKMLVDLVPPTARLGEITPQAAAETGLPEGLPVIAAAADKACEVLGAGSLAPHSGSLSYGTTATINVTRAKYTEVIPLIPPYPAAVPGRYSLEVQIYRGYWMVRWFKEEFGQIEQRMAEEMGTTPEALFDMLVDQVPPGSLGLLLQPYWTPGVRQPGPEARGAIIGFNADHTRAHLYRAILEGLAYALREGLERIERRTHSHITELRVSGGGSQSDAALQLTADIFGLPTIRPHTYETSGLGAAIVASVGMGLHPDFETAVREMTRVGKVFTPRPATHEVYDALYRRVYRQMYRRLKPLYEEIHAITRGQD